MRIFDFLILCATLLATIPVSAASYVIDHGNSSLAFAGTHADNPFNGTFKEWSANIDFDPDHLDQSSITAIIKTTSAETGNAMYDGTLPQKDWFNTKEHAEATFKSTAITHKGDNVFTVSGELTLRGITQPVSFDFTLSDLSHNPVTAKAIIIIDRLAFDIGKKSDDKAEWVSREITLTLDISATKQ